MKKLACLLFCLTALNVAPMSAQPMVVGPSDVANAESKLTRFDLDFPGGTPRELAMAIQKAMNRPLNVIIPTEQADWKLPPLKMSGVNAAELFRALSAAMQSPELEVGFFRREALPSDQSVWYFKVQQGHPGKVARFYLLTPYLEVGLTVDDISTAIRTAWKMRGDAATPNLSFHQETKLLIAVGEPTQLSTVDDVLRALEGAVRAKSAEGKSRDDRKTDR